MSEKNKTSNNLSIEDLMSEGLKSTEENISEMENILELMDEIDLMKKNSNVDKTELARLQNTVGGYSRIEIVDLIDELKDKRNKTQTEIEKEKNELEKENRELKGEVDQIKDDITKLTKLFSKQVEINKLDSKADIMDTKMGNDRFDDLQNELAKLKQEFSEKKETVFVPEEAKQLKAGDNTFMLESIYNGLSSEIEALKKSISEEMNYSYQQKQAIYEDISEQLKLVNGFDVKSFEEKLTEISQLKSTDIKVLEDKIEKLNLIDTDSIVNKIVENATDKISKKVIETISENLLLTSNNNANAGLNFDVDTLTEKIVAKLALNSTNIADEEMQKLSNDFKELKNQLGNIINNKDNSEFGLIDYEIQEYLLNASPVALKDLLVDARNLKNKALKYIENGNNKKGEDIISGLRTRLKNTIVSGSKAIGDIIVLMDDYHIPLLVNRAKLVSLKSLMFKYEQESIIPKIELLNDIIRTKKDAFKDSELTVFDKQTFDEINAEAKGLDLGIDINEEKAEKLKVLKKELMSFNLAALFDFDLVRIGSEITDTDLLLAEIKSLKKEMKGGSIIEADGNSSGLSELSSLTEELSEIAKIASYPDEDATPVKKTRGKAKKILRPAIPLPNPNDKVYQPLSNKKNKIKIDINDNSDSLSNFLVKKLAENMTSKIGKK